MALTLADKYEKLSLNISEMIKVLGNKPSDFSDALLSFYDVEVTEFSFPNNFCSMFVESSQLLEPNNVASSCMELREVIIRQYGESKGEIYFKIFSWPIWLTQSFFEIMNKYPTGSEILISHNRYNLICELVLRCRKEFIGVFNQFKEIDFHIYEQLVAMYSLSHQSNIKLDDAFLPTLEASVKFIDLSELNQSTEYLNCSNSLYLENDYWKIVTDLGYFMRDFAVCLETLNGSPSE